MMSRNQPGTYSANSKTKRVGSFRLAWRVLLFCMFTVSRVLAQGPPYQTDDPVPVDLHHYEFYIFGTADGTPVEMDSQGPAFEFNWGAIPRVQIHAILPFGGIFPSNNPIYLPGGRNLICRTARASI